MNIRKSLFSARGFATYELLMVVVVVGILASLFVPRVMEARDRGFLGAATSELAAVREALAMYALDHHGYPQGVASYMALRDMLKDDAGRPYMVLPTGQTFRWIAYNSSRSDNYLIVIQALDKEGTLIHATPDQILIDQ